MSFLFTTSDKTANGTLTSVLIEDEWDFSKHLHGGDIATMENAERLAREATALTGREYIATDASEYVSPRYDVMEAPLVGEPVSYAFNGDCYPDGHVTHVTSGTHRIIKTDTGSVYYRHKKSSTWVKKGGTWCLVKGHIKSYNREF